MNEVFHTDCLELCKWMPDNSVDLIIIDPPYMITHEEWDMQEVVTEELSSELFRIAKESCSLYCWCGIGEKSQSLIRWFPIFSKLWHFKDCITWKKQRGIGMRKGWLYTREEILWYVKNNKQFVWNVEYQYSSTEKRTFTLACWKGKTRGGDYKRLTNVWTDIFEIGMGTSPQQAREIARYAGHFTCKPHKAIERIILAHTKEKDVVFDCFVGSGTTCIVAKKLNRQYVGGDINEHYVLHAQEELAK